MSSKEEGKPKLVGAVGALSKIGSVQELQEAIWEIVAKLRKEIANQGTLIDTLPLKACHVVATLAGVYARLHETSDLETRLSELERKVLNTPS